MNAIGMCSTCGAELAAGEKHADSCAEDAFVVDDPEYGRLASAVIDASDDYQICRRRSKGGPAVARARAKLDRLEEALKAREDALRKEFQRRHGT